MTGIININEGEIIMTFVTLIFRYQAISSFAFLRFQLRDEVINTYYIIPLRGTASALLTIRRGD